MWGTTACCFESCAPLPRKETREAPVVKAVLVRVVVVVVVVVVVACGNECCVSSTMCL